VKFLWEWLTWLEAISKKADRLYWQEKHLNFKYQLHDCAEISGQGIFFATRSKRRCFQMARAPAAWIGKSGGV
jgi:hypothetical protein